MIQTFGIGAMTNAAYYLVFTFVVDRRSHAPGAGSEFLLANTLSLVIVLFSKGFGGWLSDHIGRRYLMLLLTVVTMALIHPMLRIMLRAPVEHFAWSQMLMAIPLGMALGLQGSMVVELFPLRTRVTSVSFGYSLMIAAAGGTAPLISVWLINRYGFDLAPGYYILALGVLALAVLLPMRETNGARLDR
jgi:MHS family proline/betaine transporter-like MFS transporter